jgi:hypothetical protein
MEERRRKGLCYSCDSKSSRGHICSVLKLFLIETIGEVPEDRVQELSSKEVDPGGFFAEEFPEISLNAIICSPSPKTIRLLGILRYQKVTALIDSSSTHNFLDLKIVTLLGLQPMVHK